jgi:NADPH:quinone reductase-like Zn-dependent oxidoreductase
MQNKAVIADPSAPAKLVIRDAAMPAPQRNEALIKVAAISLNRGETRRALAATEPWTPGWDLAGTVERAAADGSGPKAGARVVGILMQGAWARYVAVPTHAVAALPDMVTFAQAATFPVAGLTALHALQKGGLLLERKVLITGATGGVGDFAIQLARAGGARVIAVARRAEQAAALKALGAHEVVLGADLASAKAHAPYHLIVDSVGGKSLGAALGLLGKTGTCVTLGASESAEAMFDLRTFFIPGRTTLYGLYLFQEIEVEHGTVGLRRLAAMVANGSLKPTISREASWGEIAKVAAALIDRSYPGKAVLHVD